MVALLRDALLVGQSHSEFKKSLSELREGAKAVVAFANAHGGDLFFGVTDDKQVVGVRVGANTMEQLAANLDRLIYPLRASCHRPHRKGRRQDGDPSFDGSRLAAGDRSIRVQFAVAPARRACSTDRLRAYRRVGRTDRQVLNFMWLRPRLASDPLVFIDNEETDRAETFPISIKGKAWLEAGIAHDLRVCLDPSRAQATFRVRIFPNSLSYPFVAWSRTHSSRLPDSFLRAVVKRVHRVPIRTRSDSTGVLHEVGQTKPMRSIIGSCHEGSRGRGNT